MCKSAISTKDFLTTLYPEPFDGAFVEIRILSDQYQKCFGQHWFKSKEEIIDQFDELCAEGAKEHACVAFSPALRNGRVGNKRGVKGTWCLWVDIDPTEDRTKAECIQRLIDDEISMTVVDSGHGAHGYIHLTEFLNDIEQIELVNLALRCRFGGDHVQDACRVMRLPGTSNFKDVENPCRCEVVHLTDERYDVDVLVQMLDDAADYDLCGASDQEQLLTPEARPWRCATMWPWREQMQAPP